MLKDLLKMLAVIPLISKRAVIKVIYFYAIQEHCDIQALLPSHSDFSLLMVTTRVSLGGCVVGLGLFCGFFYTEATFKLCLITAQAAPLHSRPPAVWKLFIWLSVLFLHV